MGCGADQRGEGNPDPNPNLNVFNPNRNPNRNPNPNRNRNPSPSPNPNPNQAFVRCATFDPKQKPGDDYVFKRGRLGVGFYRDVPPGAYKHVPLGALGLNAPRHAPHQGWHRPKQLARDTMVALPGPQRGDRAWRYTPNHR